MQIIVCDMATCHNNKYGIGYVMRKDFLDNIGVICKRYMNKQRRENKERKRGKVNGNVS